MVKTTKLIEFNLINKLIRYVNKYGVEKTMQQLSDEDDRLSVVFEDAYTNKVLTEIATIFSINKEDLLFKKHTRSDIKFAIGFSVFYLYYENKMTIRSINDIVFSTKNKSLLSKYRLLIEGLNPKYKSDIPYLKIKTQLDTLLKK
jgi:hypothetical protein